MNTSVLILLILALSSKIFISLWVYKDAKSRGLNGFLWSMLVLFLSGSLVFLIYILVVRKERNIQCRNCNFNQSEKLVYCGRCGSEIKIDRYEEDLNKNTNKVFLNIGIGLLIISMIMGIVMSFGVLWEERDGISVSFMSVSSKYNNTWKDRFKYKNGEKSHNFNIKEKTKLDASWDVDDGYIEAILYKGDEIIRKLNSSDEPNYKELIDLSDYEGSKVTLKLKFRKASGKIEFILK